jgi:ribosome-associated protein
MKLPRPLEAAVDAAKSKLAQDLVVLDVQESASFTDYFLLASGSSQRQVIAIVDAVLEVLRAAGVRPDHVEGYPRQEWILLDYGGFIVHVFTPRQRSFYDLERLWGQARRWEVPE